MSDSAMIPGRIPGIVDRAIADATDWGVERLEVIMVRHGRPLAEDSRRPAGALDPPLSDLGRRQAETAARALRGDGVEMVYSSDLARASETALIIGAALDVPVRMMAGLREIPLHRESDDEANAPAGQDAAAFVADGRWEAVLQPGLDPAFRGRVRRALGEITAGRATGAVAVVCHSGVINAQLADVLRLDRDYFVRPAHASITRVRLSSGRWTLQSVNETAHIRRDLLTA